VRERGRGAGQSYQAAELSYDYVSISSPLPHNPLHLPTYVSELATSTIYIFKPMY
jgi:hypothetical protein